MIRDTLRRRWVVLMMTGGGAMTALSVGAGCPAPNPDAGLVPEAPRAAFASQCALNVIECTTAFPVAVIEVEPGADQIVTETANGFLVQGYSGVGSEFVRLVGSNSEPGQGATEIFHSWSHAADDDDPRTLSEGEVFSTEADPVQEMQVGFHYIRLTVRNDIVVDQLVSPEFGVLYENTPLFDFVEVEIEVRDR